MAENKIPDIVAMFDQMATQAENIAVVIAAYREKLISEKGMQKNYELIDSLTAEFAHQIWEKLFYPEGKDNHE